MSNDKRPDLVLGTAGHIDHGKSTLIHALTGTDPDRLSEEKERGITITLGFAQLHLPDGRAMGVVDLPGHEKFVRQMISGATGIDVALLVVAADDGVMPQTVEHMSILQTLGIRACVVALTKIDLAEKEWVDFVAEDVRSRLASTPYKDAPIIPVSSKTGKGLDEIRMAIQEAAGETDRTHTGTALRYPIDRVFTIKGAGTVLTGTIWSGLARTGDMVEILPSKKQCRIRSIQMFGETLDVAYPGNRVAINLSNIKTSEIHPGDFLAQVDAIEPSDRFDAYITYMDTDETGKAITSGARMHIAHGTREIIGRVLFADGKPTLEPGESTLAQFRLDEPLALSYGDRFVMRTYSPVRIAGGGRILLAHPRRRTNFSPKEHEMIDYLMKSDTKSALICAVENESVPATLNHLARLIGLEPPLAASLLEEATKDGSVITLGSSTKYFTTKEAVRQAAEKIAEELLKFHAENPKDLGIGKDALRHKCFPKMDTACFDELLACAVEEDCAFVDDAFVSHPSTRGAAQKSEEDTAEKFYAMLKEAGLAPATIQQMAKELNVEPPLARKAMALLCKQGRAWSASSDLYFEGALIEERKKAVAEHLAAGGEGSVAALRDVIGASRKYVVPLLESFDVCGFTVRRGDTRSLGKQ